MKPWGNLNVPWKLCSYSEAYYVGGNDTCNSVIGYFILVNRAVIEWCSLSHETITLLIAEYEYSEFSEVCCNILFIHVILFLLEILFNEELPYMLITLDLYTYFRSTSPLFARSLSFGGTTKLTRNYIIHFFNVLIFE